MSARTQRLTLALAITLTALAVLVGFYKDHAIFTGIASIVLLIEIALVAPVFERADW